MHTPHDQVFCVRLSLLLASVLLWLPSPLACPMEAFVGAVVAFTATAAAAALAAAGGRAAASDLAMALELPPPPLAGTIAVTHWLGRALAGGATIGVTAIGAASAVRDGTSESSRAIATAAPPAGY